MNFNHIKTISLFITLFCNAALIFSQGNYNDENFGNKSILLSGSVTGSVEDLGLTYYNPARIALIEVPSFTINAKAYQLNSVNVKNIFGNNNKLSDSRFNGVPSLVSGLFKIKKWENHHFAYSFLTKQNNNISLNFSRDITPNDISDETERLVSDFNNRNRETDEWFGLTWGTKLKDNLSIGASMFFSGYSYSGSSDLIISTLSDTDDVDVFYNYLKFGQSSYGIFTKVGVAWKVDKYELGLNIDLPYLEVVNSGKFRYQKYTTSDTDDDAVFQNYEYNNLSSKRKEPIAISIGAGFPIGRNKIHLKTDWHGKIAEYKRLTIPKEDEFDQDYSLKEALNSVINFGIGLEIYLNSNVNIYGSFSTDFSPLNSNIKFSTTIEDENTDLRDDYFHYGLGLDFKLKKVQLILGATYSYSSVNFSNLRSILEPPESVTFNDEAGKIVSSRWRFIIGLEIPIFGENIKIQ